MGFRIVTIAPFAARLLRQLVDHLFLGCVFARELWWHILSPIGLDALMPELDDDLGSWWINQRGRLDSTARQTFDSMLLLTVWTLWKERNCRTFCGITAHVRQDWRSFIQECEDWVTAGYSSLAVPAAVWSQKFISEM